MEKTVNETAATETAAAEKNQIPQQETGLSVSVKVDDTGLTAELTNRKQMFCSIDPDSRQAKAVVFKAMSNPDKRIGDCINQNIKVKDVFVEMIELTNKETGELTIVPRTVLIDVGGVSYQAVSSGIYSALKKLIQVYGVPTWADPIEIKILQISRKANRNILTFDVIG